MRFGPVGPWGYPQASPYSGEQEATFLREQAAALKEEMNAIDRRLRDLESEGKGSE